MRGLVGEPWVHPRFLALQWRHGQPVVAELLPVQLRPLAVARPHDGLPRVVDLVRNPEALLVRDAGDHGRKGERDTFERVVVVVEHDYAPGVAAPAPRTAGRSPASR